MWCFALICVVMVNFLNMCPCDARPSESTHMNLSENGLEKLNAESTEFTYKLPTTLEGMIIIIKGTLNINHETFTAKLPSNSPDSTLPDCEFIYNFATKKLDIIPASSTAYEPPTYIMDIVPGKKKTFELRLKARKTLGNPIIDFNFEGGNNGPSETLACKIKNLMDIDHIVMNGVESVDSLLFEFPK